MNLDLSVLTVVLVVVVLVLTIVLVYKQSEGFAPGAGGDAQPVVPPVGEPPVAGPPGAGPGAASLGAGPQMGMGGDPCKMPFRQAIANKNVSQVKLMLENCYTDYSMTPPAGGAPAGGPPGGEVMTPPAGGAMTPPAGGAMTPPPEGVPPPPPL